MNWVNLCSGLIFSVSGPAALPGKSLILCDLCDYPDNSMVIKKPAVKALTFYGIIIGQPQQTSFYENQTALKPCWNVHPSVFNLLAC
jgi:hypothetical protein